MPREVPEIDRLIEEGLTLYGQGDLDGALTRWEKALAIDPDNSQANSYVEYVRANYELLTNDVNGERTSEGTPFGIADDEPEYQIEIQPGEIKATNPTVSQPLFMDPLDEGWAIDEETHDMSTREPKLRDIAVDKRPSQDVTLELEADEPPVPARPQAEPPHGTLPGFPPADGVNFEDATREYSKRDQIRRAASDPYGGFEPAPMTPVPASEFGPSETPAFGHPMDFQTPPGFGTQATGIKQRNDLGFVQPKPEAPAVSTRQTKPGTGAPPTKPAGATHLGLPDKPRAPAKPSEPPPEQAFTMPAASMDDLTLEPADLPTMQRAPLRMESEGEPEITTSPANEFDEDLISSLPSPRPAPSVPQIDIDTPLSGAPADKKSTKDFPQQTRKPAFATAKTREMSPDEKPVVGATQTQDFEAKTKERVSTSAPPLSAGETREIPNMAQQAALISAPTRDLGMREVAAAQATTVSRDGTRADVVLPFDPIDARSTEILEDVDETAPKDEAKEDQTRRRITTLFEKAAQWSSEGDLERAVAAVDLALSEDPNAALAQKLIHRNRETIMNVFQAYLGDLQRTPQLARPLHELASAPISPRAAFLLSRIDGLLSIDEILDVCGMPRLEAYRYLCQLFLRGILR